MCVGCGDGFMSGQYYVYIVTNKNDAVLYTGVCNDLKRRIGEHKEKKGSVFTSKYNVGKLVYFEVFGHIEAAIKREKQIKSWGRDWKVKVIEGKNPGFSDLYESLF
jgi:putative endonuclease